MITQEQHLQARRELIQTIWRRVNKTDAELVASENEWLFFDALLDELYGPHWIPHITTLNNQGK